MRLWLGVDPNQLNPILSQNSFDGFVDTLMFSKLLEVDDRGREVPELAARVPTLANGDISKNGLTITYHLRKNARWQDGRPVTSHDVKFTWRAIMNPANNVVSRTGFSRITSIDTPDDWTVVVHMKKIFPPMIDAFFGESDAGYEVLPEHLLAKYPNLNQIPFNAAPVGDGPFTFKSWSHNDRIVLEANPGYFRGKPKLSEIVLRIVRDANTTVNLLRTHDLDVAWQVTPPQYRAFVGDPGFREISKAAPFWNSLSFNLDHPPFNDKSVRLAIALAIDRTALVQKSTYGTGIVPIADQTPFSWAWDPTIAPVPYDPARAKALLHGRRFSVTMVEAAGYPMYENVSAQIQQMLRKVGINVTIKTFDPEMLYAAAGSGGIFNGGKFDMGWYPWVAGADPDDSSLWTCANRTPEGFNITHYCSAKMDDAQRMALSTYDRATRKAAYRKIQQLLVRDVPATFLFYNPDLTILSQRVHGFASNGLNAAWNAYDWSVDR